MSATGAFSDSVQFFCEALAAQANDAEQRIRTSCPGRTNALGSEVETAKGVALDVVGRLIEFPTVSVKAVSDLHGVSNQAANSAVTRLVSSAYLRNRGNEAKPLFQAPRRLLDRLPADPIANLRLDSLRTRWGSRTR